MENTTKSVQDYYGKELQSSSDLKTNACCTAVTYPDKIKKILAKIHDEVMTKYYGCGLTIPSELNGLRILDLGSGSGRDCYLASKLVGENGYVIGVDMTDEQLAVANRHIDYHTEQFGYKKSNVEFKKGHIEQLDELNIDNNSLDLIISNCVINLSTNKLKVLSDCFNKLKQGGEMYFSDVYVNKRIPKELASDPVIYGECLGGALYWNDFLTFAKKAGFQDPRVVEVAPITIENKELEEKLEGFEFYSVTYRLFKIAELETDCEDYGQAVIYKGTIDDLPNSFQLDTGHFFAKGKVEAVCGNTYLMLHESRYKKHFEFIGDFSTHYGIFEGCGSENPFAHVTISSDSSGAGSCC
ncbi:methyltransferase domain-containing protein [Bacteriovorax sp. Seq25_V]|uniref:methyltransferase domain-containing protein n=1 Tax=Bacteriovorax sp. Seq25_V TaxID=1201288 RepID=UPI00038A3852|nr:methyltransferase domain-containing protein [Bacteriovorax sp. Seq25_V]EQC47633.1 methyltransferase domain protein [Bacteriovorax sp. Seq25_V]